MSPGANLVVDLDVDVDVDDTPAAVIGTPVYV